jgi:tRNA pseudouridine13 synthase
MIIDPVNPPRLHGEPLGTARFKSQPDDFQVEEILGFEPSGSGEHCLLWVEKTDRNSNDVATWLADRLGIRKRLVSHCGLKDKNAITRQWFSIHLPGQESPNAADLETDGIRILTITRNLRKLHRGSHDANRFIISLRDCTFSKEAATGRWQQLATRGVPNYFGPQRFGRDNINQARRFLSGQLEIRDRALRGILISAARSYLFNACVAARVLQKNWDTPLDGEVFGFAVNRSLILPNNLHGDETTRVKDGVLELTAPLWGEGDLISQNDVIALEQSAIANHPEIALGLAQFNLKQERRVIRLTPQSPNLSWEHDNTLTLSFTLPKGTYATALLREFTQLEETSF